MKAHKTISVFGCTILAACLVQSCILSDYGMDRSIFAGDPLGREPHRPQSGKEEENRPDLPEGMSLYFSTVEFEDGYDWQQDSAYCKAAADIALYIDYQESKRIKCGELVSYDPDLHHVVDGHIYTEQCVGDRTYIGKDGEPILEIPERVRLEGLVEKDGVLYTLSRPLSGKGLILRRDEDILLRRMDGVAYGGFQYASYPENGALYLDAGSLVFCYHVGDKAFYVCDGIESQMLTSNTVLDVKFFNSTLSTMYKNINLGVWRDGQAWISEDYCTDSGTRYNDGGWGTWAYDYNFSSLIDFGPPGGTVYASESGLACLHYINGGIKAIYLPYKSKAYDRVAAEEGVDLSPTGRYRFISEKCAMLVGDTLIIGLSAAEKGACPSIMEGERITELKKVNGFISSINIRKQCI